MNTLKDHLLKQQKLNLELNSILEELNNQNTSNDVQSTSKEDFINLKNIQTENVSIQGRNIDVLRNKALERLNDKKNPLSHSERNKMLKTIGNINKLQSDYTKLEKELFSVRGITKVNDSTREAVKQFDNLENIESISNKNTEIVNSKGVNATSQNNDIKNFLDVKMNINEKNLGFYLINFLGLLLLIIGFSTFGKYIYNNYMTDLIKGIFLFAISLGVFALGETILSKKNPKFAESFSALGICGLYMSTFINYLFLDNFNEITALVISSIISLFAIYLSSKKDSIAIRILALVGGFITFMPTNQDTFIYGYDIISSLMVIVFVGLLNTANLYKPIKKNVNVFSIFSVVSNGIFMLISFIFIDYSVIILLLMINMFCNYYVHKKYTTDNILFTIFNMAFILSTMAIGVVAEIIMLIVCIFFIYSEDKKLSYYVGAVILTLNLLILNVDVPIVLALASIVLLLLNVYIDTKKPHLMLKIMDIVLLIVLFCTSGELDSVPIIALFNNIAIFSMMYLYIPQKEGKTFKSLKYLSLAYLYGGICSIAEYYDISSENYKYLILIGMFILVGAIAIYTNISQLKDSKYKIDNIVFMSILTLMSLSIMADIDINSFMSFIVLIIATYCFVRDEYVLPINIMSMESLRGVLIAVTTILNVLNLGAVVSPIIVNVLIMTVAVASVAIGFVRNDMIMRKLGIGITVLLCGKLLLFDILGMDYIQKTITFIIVGILALGISYIYAKIDKKHKEN